MNKNDMNEEYCRLLDNFINSDIVYAILVPSVYTLIDEYFYSITKNKKTVFQRFGKSEFVALIDDVIPYILYDIYNDICKGTILSGELLFLFDSMNRNLSNSYHTEDIVKLIMKKLISILIQDTYNFNTCIDYKQDTRLYKITFGISNDTNIENIIDIVMNINEQDVKKYIDNSEYVNCELYDRLNSYPAIQIYNKYQN